MFSSAGEKQTAKPEIQNPNSITILICILQLPRVLLLFAGFCVCHSSLLSGSGITSYKD